MMRLETPALLGKVPWRDEYLNVGVDGPSFRVFDRWLTENIEFAAARAGDRWEDAYRAGVIHAFVFRPMRTQLPLLAGAISPSFDSAGRNYPLVVASTVARAHDFCRTPEALPLLLEEFWQLSSGAVAVARATRDFAPSHFGDDAADVDGTAVVSAYADWAQKLPLVELWDLVYGAGGAANGRSAVRLVLEAIRPSSGVELSDTPLTLRLPLGSVGGAAVCFWIELVRRSARWKVTIPSFFWSHDGNTGTMLLHLGVPPKSTLAELWLPTQQRDEFCDLLEFGDPQPMRSLDEPPPALARVLSSASATVRDLMLAIG
jgi:type VI secretion system ImpM family protein